MNKKKLYLITVAFSFALYAILSYGIGLLYTYANTNIILYTSVLPEILSILIDLIETAVLAIAFSAILFSAFGFGSHLQPIGLTAVLSAALLFRRISDLLAIRLVYGEINAQDIAYGITYLALELLLIWFIFSIICILQKRWQRSLAVTSSVLFEDGAPLETETLTLFSFQKIFSPKNPLQLSSLVIGCVLSLVKIGARIIYDIDYGAPSGLVEILVMAVYYLSDILIGIIFYAIASLFLMRFIRRSQKTER